MQFSQVKSPFLLPIFPQNARRENQRIVHGLLGSKEKRERLPVGGVRPAREGKTGKQGKESGMAPRERILAPILLVGLVWAAPVVQAQDGRPGFGRPPRPFMQ